MSTTTTSSSYAIHTDTHSSGMAGRQQQNGSGGAPPGEQAVGPFCRWSECEGSIAQLYMVEPSEHSRGRRMTGTSGEHFVRVTISAQSQTIEIKFHATEKFKVFQNVFASSVLFFSLTCGMTRRKGHVNMWTGEEGRPEETL